MKLRIIVDNELEEFHGKMSRKTFEKIPLAKRPKLIENHYFYLGDPNNREIIIQIDKDIIEDGSNLYLHQTGKRSYGIDNEFIEF
ncbi:hypothetical protein [Anaerophaga thermohalophila]|jgi:hypothetical protein|uniref:hypothetical protein n=1 Tax=Anaerophaga thermohalophila TaxID=177400 RepID=UPI0003122E5E|nr:hypothetical protein [Anaerophaga thermohalophila]